MTITNQDSLLQRATRNELKPFESWPKTGRPAGYFTLPMTDQAVQFYKENGFIVIENALNPAEVHQLTEETARLCRNEEGIIAGVDPADPSESDAEVMKRILCLHFPHKMSPTMFNFLKHDAYVDVLTNIIGPNVKAMQSMLFVKASGKPGQAWHQDEDFIPTRDRSLTGGWIALDDATVENGCLWVIPKSHQRGLLFPQKSHADSRFDCAHESYDYPWSDDDSVPVELKAGSIVFFNGYLLHRSLPNRAKTGFRRSLVNHYMSAESLLPWVRPEEGQGMALADYRDIIMIAGKDPYAYKGITSLSKAHVRPSGEGGCENWGKEKNRSRALLNQELTNSGKTGHSQLLFVS